MKKKLLGFVLCLGIVSLFGFSNITYKSSTIVYTENNINLIGEQVSVRGIDEGAFHVLNVDGETGRLFADFAVASGYKYNSSSDGDIPVAFEDSMLYQGLQNGTKTWKSDIESNGGKTHIYLVDAPTIEELSNVGNLSKRESVYSTSYLKTDKTPDWIFGNGDYITKSITDDGEVYITNSFDGWFESRNPINADSYGGGVRPVLETSLYNLSSDNEEIQSYLNNVRAEMDAKDNQSNDNVSNDDKAQVVKIPSTGINAPIVFTVVGLAVLVIAGIVIWVIVKDKRAKK